MKACAANRIGWVLLLSLVFCGYEAKADGCQSADFSFVYDDANCIGYFTFEGITDCGIGAENSTWVWDFGDGSPPVYNEMNPTHEYLFEGTYTVTLWMYPTCHGPGSAPCINTESILVEYPNMEPVVPMVVSDYNGSHVSCAEACDGIVEITSIGADFSFSWVDFPDSGLTVSGVCVGTYEVFATPNDGCGNTVGTVVVEPPPTFGYDVNASFAGCAGTPGGSVTIAPVGGGPPYALVWLGDTITTVGSSLTFNDLMAGVYAFVWFDACGEEQQGQIEVVEPPPLIPEAFVTSDYNGVHISCTGASDGAIQVQAEGGVPPYQFSWQDIGSSQAAVEGLMEGNYSVEVTDAIGCVQATQVALVDPPPVAVEVGVTSDYNGADISCYAAEDGEASVFSITGGVGTSLESYSIEWCDVPSGCNAVVCFQPLANQNGSVLEEIGQGTVAAVVADANGCQADDAVDLVEPTPVTVTPASTQDYNGWDISCFGFADGGVAALAEGGTGVHEYEWIGGAVDSDMDGLAAGWYPVTATDVNGCQALDSIQLLEPTPLQLTIEVVTDYNGAQISCFDSADGGLAGEASGGVEPYVVLWNGGPESLQWQGLPEGEYSATLTDNNGCVTQESEELLWPPELVVELEVTTDYNGYPISCHGFVDGGLVALAGGGTGALEYSWGGIGILAAQGTEAEVGSGVFDVLVTDANGCIALDSVPVVEPLPVVTSSQVITSYNGYDISCFEGDDGAISVEAQGGVPGYQLVASGGEYSLDSTVIVQGLSAGTFVYTLQDLNGCVAEGSISLGQPDPIIYTASVATDYNGSDISCFGADDAAVVVNATGGVHVLAVGWEDNAHGAITDSIWGPGFVGFQIVDANGCVVEDSVLVETPSPVSLSVEVSNYNGVNISCAGYENGVIEAEGVGGTGGLVYSWNGAAGGDSIGGLGPGLYEVIVEDVNGCPDTSLVELIEPAAMACEVQVVTDYNGYSISCYGAADGGVEVAVTGGTEPHTVTWFDGVVGVAREDLNVFADAVGAYDVNGCVTDCPFALTQPPPLHATITSWPDTCGFAEGGMEVDLSGGVAPLEATTLWMDSLHDVTQVGLDAMLPGEYVLELIDDNGCSAQFEYAVGLVPGPELDWSTIPNPICAGQEVTIATEVSKEVVMWAWTLPGGLFEDGPNPEFFAESPGVAEASVLIIDEHNCALDSLLFIDILDGMTIYVPNAFTPDGDGINQDFGAEGDLIDAYHLQVFNRWGELVFESFSINERWDGSVDGRWKKSDLYQWKVTASGPCGVTRQIMGHVTIVR